MSPIPGFNAATLFSYLLSPTAFWVVFLAAVGIFIIYSLLLLYHWLRYGFTSVLMWVSMAVYFAGGVALLLIMLFAVANL